MSLSIISQPTPFAFSKSPVAFKLYTDEQLTNDLLLLFTVQVWDDYYGIYQDVYSGNVRFDNNGMADLDIQRIVDANVQYFIAQPWDTGLAGTSYLVDKNQCKRFRVTFQLHTSGGSIYTSGSLITTGDYYIAKGGIQSDQWDRDSVYNYFWANAQRFLHFHHGDTIFRTQGFAMISFLANQDYASCEFRYSFVSAGGIPAYTLIDLAGIVKGDYVLVQIPLYNNPTDVVLTYGLRNTADTTNLSEVITLNLDQREFAQTKFFSYLNSIGGTEFIALPYNKLMQTTVTADTFNRFTSSADAGYHMVVDPQSFQTNYNEQLAATIDSGAVALSQMNNLRQMLISAQVFELVLYGRIEPKLKLIPVTVGAASSGSSNNSITNTLSSRSSGSGLMPFQLTVVRAFTNMSYTPDDAPCRIRITGSSVTGINTPVEFATHIWITPPPAGPYGSIDFTADAASVWVDFGDNVKTDISTGHPIHNYTDRMMRLISLYKYYMQPFNQLIINGSYVSRLQYLPKELDFLQCNGQILTSLPPLPVALIQLNVNNNKLNLVPDISALTNLLHLDISDNLITDFGYAVIPASVTYFNASGNKLPAWLVDFIINKINANNPTGTYGTIILNGQSPAAPPTSVSASAKAALIARHWTVTTD